MKYILIVSNRGGSYHYGPWDTEAEAKRYALRFKDQNDDIRVVTLLEPMER